MYTCANCTVLACANNEPEKMPKNCPMRNASVMEAARAGYDLSLIHISCGPSCHIRCIASCWRASRRPTLPLP